MTLTSRFRIVEPKVDVDTLWARCAELVEATPEAIWTDHAPGERPWQRDFSRRMQMGQGFRALLWLEWGADGPLARADEPEDDYIDESPNAAYEVTIDTPYGYRGEFDETCSQLHDRLFGALGAWCDERGMDWHAYNEFTGEWHHQALPYAAERVH